VFGVPEGVETGGGVRGAFNADTLESPPQCNAISPCIFSVTGHVSGALFSELLQLSQIQTTAEVSEQHVFVPVYSSQQLSPCEHEHP